MVNNKLVRHKTFTVDCSVVSEYKQTNYSAIQLSVFILNLSSLYKIEFDSIRDKIATIT